VFTTPCFVRRSEDVLVAADEMISVAADYSADDVVFIPGRVK
jgi:hypothetical protein